MVGLAACSAPVAGTAAAAAAAAAAAVAAPVRECAAYLPLLQSSSQARSHASGRDDDKRQARRNNYESEIRGCMVVVYSYNNGVYGFH